MKVLIVLSHWEYCNAVVMSWIINYVSTDLVGCIVHAINAYLVWSELKEKFDRVNGARIFFLHKKISMASKGTLLVSTYFTKLTLLWDEYASLVPLSYCNCEQARTYVLRLD